MELRIQIDKKTGLVLLAAVVAGMVGGALTTCIMLHEEREHGSRMEQGGYDGMVGYDGSDSGDGNFYYATEVTPTAGTEATPTAKRIPAKQ